MTPSTISPRLDGELHILRIALHHLVFGAEHGEMLSLTFSEKQEDALVFNVFYGSRGLQAFSSADPHSDQRFIQKVLGCDLRGGSPQAVRNLRFSLGVPGSVGAAACFA